MFGELMVDAADNYLDSIVEQVEQVRRLPAEMRAYLVNDLRRADDMMPSAPECEVEACPEDAWYVVPVIVGYEGRCVAHLTA